MSSQLPVRQISNPSSSNSTAHKQVRQRELLSTGQSVTSSP